MNREILRFVDSIHRDRQVDKEIIFIGIEQALVSAAQKKFGADDEQSIQVNIDRETGAIEATIDGEELSPGDLGRIAALSGKQVLLQKIREAEREVIHAEYEPKIGSMMTGTVQSRKPGGVLVVSLGKVEGIIPRSEQSAAENFNEGDRIKFILAEVNLQPHRVQLICSRAHPDLVQRLFELEIPEVADGVVEVRAIAREAGHRTKIAVATNDNNVDCVGACVGVKGSRIRNIVDELFGEKIDIVRWHEDIADLIVESLRPAEIASLELELDEQKATVYVKPEQQSLAIGRRGQNVRLASKLTGWDLDITSITEEELEAMRIESMESRADGLFSDRLAQIEEQEAEAQPEDRLDELMQAVVEEKSAEEEAPEEVEEGGEAFDEALKAAMSTTDGPPRTLEGFPELGGASDSGDALGEHPSTDEEETEADLEDTVVNDATAVDAEAGTFDLEELPGVGKVSSERLREAGLDSAEKLLDAGLESLAAIDGIGETRARQILEYLSSRMV